MSMEHCLLPVLLIGFLVKFPILVWCEVTSFSNLPIQCDFDKYLDGCEDSIGSYCDRESLRCLCKQGYPIRLFKYCLKYAKINESCYTSRQCNETPNAACYILGTEYDHSGSHHVGSQISDWPPGSCRCRIGHLYDQVNGTCVKKTIGSWCNYDRDCNKANVHSYCNKKSFKCDCVYGYTYNPNDDSCSPKQVVQSYGSKCVEEEDCERDDLICISGRCRCPKDYHVDIKFSRFICKPNNDSACSPGYRWSIERERCVPKSKGSRYSDLNDLDGIDGEESDDGWPISLSTIIMFVVANLVILVVVRYCYLLKREDSEEDLAERGHIRPTHMLHKPYLVGGDLGCTGQDMYINGEIKCPEDGERVILSYDRRSPDPIERSAGDCCISNETVHHDNDNSNHSYSNNEDEDSGVKTSTDEKSENELEFKDSPHIEAKCRDSKDEEQTKLTEESATVTEDQRPCESRELNDQDGKECGSEGND